MISEINKQNSEAFLSIIAGKPYFEVCMGADFQLYKNMPQITSFFLADDKCAVQIKGDIAIICGEVQNKPELDTFINMYGINAVRSKSYLPNGFIKALTLYNMHCPGVNDKIDFAVKDADISISIIKSVREILPVIESADFTGEKLDNFYADRCRKINIGKAEIWAAYKKNNAIATAGMHFVYKNSAYLAAVETLPQYRCLGIGSKLVLDITEKFIKNGYNPQLTCRKNRINMYEKIGYKITDIVQLSKREENPDDTRIF